MFLYSPSSLRRGEAADARAVMRRRAPALRRAVRRARRPDFREAEEARAALEALVVVSEKSGETRAVGACRGACGRAAVLGAPELETVARAEGVCCAGSASGVVGALGAGALGAGVLEARGAHTVLGQRGRRRRVRAGRTLRAGTLPPAALVLARRACRARLGVARGVSRIALAGSARGVGASVGRTGPARVPVRFVEGRTGLAPRVRERPASRAQARVDGACARPCCVGPGRAGHARAVPDKGLVGAAWARSARGGGVERADRVPLGAQALARLDGPFEARRGLGTRGAGVQAGLLLEEARCAGSARVCVRCPARGARARVVVSRPRSLAGGEAALERREVQALCEHRLGAGHRSQQTRAESHAEGHRSPEHHAGAGLYSDSAEHSHTFLRQREVSLSYLLSNRRSLRQ